MFKILIFKIDFQLEFPPVFRHIKKPSSSLLFPLTLLYRFSLQINITTRLKMITVFYNWDRPVIPTALACLAIHKSILSYICYIKKVSLIVCISDTFS